jgi:hypothetical protein
MKAASSTSLWLAFVLGLMLIVNGLQVGSVLEPTISGASRLAAACH